MLASKRFQRFALIIALGLGALYFMATRSQTPRKASKSIVAEFTDTESVSTASVSDTPIQKGYNWVFELISNNNPSVAPLTSYLNGQKAKEKFATDDDFVFSRQYLSDLLQVDDASFKNLKETHSTYLASILEDKHKSFNNELYMPSGEGIIFVGGIKFSWLALIGLEQLRLLGCELPVEVFIGDEGDMEDEFCNEILPKYNARCTFLEDEAGSVTKKLGVTLSGYQYKNLAFLVSKFEKILFLDADNVPMRDPTALFKSKVFTDNGLVIWPDAWARTTSPKFYDIAGINVTDKIVRGSHTNSATDLDLFKDVSFHDFEGTLPNPTSESGMILVDKTRHTKTLLLSLYYNVFGPKLYYSLMTQGSAGEGDKETFIAAATVLGTSYYQVLQPFKFVGYHRDGVFNSCALGQADPIQDYENFHAGSHINEKNNIVNAKDSKEPKVMFMHLSYPKLVPFSLLHDNEIIKPGNEHIRMYISATQEAGYDFEVRIFEIVTGALCAKYDGPTPISERLVGLKLKEYWGQDPDTFCPKLIEHTKWLQANPEK